MIKKQKLKSISSYELRKMKYPYSFYDGISYDGATITGFGLKKPEVAEDYALELLNITEKLLEDNYKIIDCMASFSDDDYGSYGEMELIKNGVRISEGIEKWKEYYLNGPGKNKRLKCKDLIDGCTLYMNLEHVKGKPHLSVDSYQIRNKTTKRKKIIKNEFKLHHGAFSKFDKKSGKYVEYRNCIWVK